MDASKQEYILNLYENHTAVQHREYLRVLLPCTCKIPVYIPALHCIAKCLWSYMLLSVVVASIDRGVTHPQSPAHGVGMNFLFLCIQPMIASFSAQLICTALASSRVTRST